MLEFRPIGAAAAAAASAAAAAGGEELCHRRLHTGESFSPLDARLSHLMDETKLTQLINYGATSQQRPDSRQRLSADDTELNWRPPLRLPTAVARQFTDRVHR